MRFCSNCGNPLGGSPRYCAGCATQVSPEDETPSGWPPQNEAATSLPVSNSASPWSFSERPADPQWSARHPSREPDGSPWPASAAPWADSPPPGGSPPPWDSPPPWAARTHPAVEDPAAAVITHDPDTRPGTRTPDTSPPRTSTPDTSPPRTRGAAWLERRPRLSPGHGMTITAMVTTVALLATGGLAAWQVGQIQSRSPAANTNLAMRGTGSARPAPTQSPAGPPARASVAPSGPTAGSAAVTVTPGAAVQPHVHGVVALLDTYFSAINQHDFQAYSSLFIPAIRATMHNFGPGYLSTRDSRARLTGLAPTGPQGLAAMVTFVSHQNPANSPDHAACDRWHVTVFVKRNGHDFHIRRHRPGFPPDTVRACT